MKTSRIIVLGSLAAAAVTALILLGWKNDADTIDANGPSVSADAAGDAGEDAPATEEAPPEARRADEATVPEKGQASDPHAPAATPTKGNLFGRILDEQGAPVSGAEVYLVPPFTRNNLPRPEDVFSFLHTDGAEETWSRVLSAPDGAYAFDAPAGTRVLVACRPPGYLEGWCETTVPATGAAPVCDLLLRRGLPIAGRLILADGRPGPAEVEIEANQRPESGTYRGFRFRKGKTDEDGRFRIEGFGPGQVALHFKVSPEWGYEFENGPGGRFEAGRQDIEFVLWGAGTVEFEARDAATGEAVTGPIRARPVHDAAPPFGVRVSAGGEAGLFALRGYARVENYRLEAQGYMDEVAWFRVTAGEKTRRPQPVLFRRGASVAGTVKRAEGALDQPAYVYYAPVADPPPWARCVCVQEDGAYAIEGLVAGRYRLRALTSGYRAGRAVVAVEAGETIQDFVLSPRKPDDPLPPADAPYAQRKEVRVSLDVQDASLSDLVIWIREIAGADIRLHENLVSVEENVTIQLSVEDIDLASALQLITALRQLELDESTGEIRKAR